MPCKNYLPANRYKVYKRNYAPGWSQPGKFGLGHRRLLDNAPPGNDSILIPPCLLSGTSYKNTCKQCNLTGVTAAVVANVTRSGVIARGGANPLGFVAPTIAVTPSGSIVILTGYAGPRAHPGSEALAYPGEGTCAASCCALASARLRAAPVRGLSAALPVVLQASPASSSLPAAPIRPGG